MHKGFQIAIIAHKYIFYTQTVDFYMERRYNYLEIEIN